MLAATNGCRTPYSWTAPSDRSISATPIWYPPLASMMVLISVSSPASGVPAARVLTPAPAADAGRPAAERASPEV